MLGSRRKWLRGRPETRAQGCLAGFALGIAVALVVDALRPSAAYYRTDERNSVFGRIMRTLRLLPFSCVRPYSFFAGTPARKTRSRPRRARRLPRPASMFTRSA